MAKGRRFIIDESVHRAYGVGSIDSLVKHSLLDSFTCFIDDETVFFDEITADELSLMTKIEYENRIIAFLSCRGITDPEEIQEFLDTATVDI